MNDIRDLLGERAYKAVEEYERARDEDGGICGPSWAVKFRGTLVRKDAADAAIRELAAALRDIHDELFRYKQLAEQHIDEAEWDTDYERAMREVVEAALREELNPWTNAVAEALRDRAEKAEQALAAAREENAKLRWQRDYVIDIAEEYGGCDFTSEDVLSLDDLWTARKEAT